MNYAIVRYVIGYVLYFEAAFMVPPCITAIIYQESCGWSFVITGLLCVLLGFILTHKKPKKQSLLYERRICHRSLKLDHTEYHGVPSLPHQRLDHQSHRRSIRDSVRFYHHRSQHYKRC